MDKVACCNDQGLTDNSPDIQETDIKKLLKRGTYGFPHDKFVYDQGGNAIKIGLFDGKLVPPFGEKSYRKIKDLPLRDDDVLLIGYPKTGCHWAWEILGMMAEGTASPTKTGKMLNFLELTTSEYLETIPHSRRRILNTHLWFDSLPKQTKEKKTKIVFTVRNPKDTAASLYNHHFSLKEIYNYHGEFKDWFPLFLNVDYGSYFDYHQLWDDAITNNPDQPILVVLYEDMKEDLHREIRKISKFLDISLSDQQVDDIAKGAGIDVMKKSYQNGTNPSYKLVRKGEVGDWQNWLTVEQSEMIDAKVAEKLRGTRFSSQRYTL